MNSLKISPVRPEHITNASHVFGPDVAGLEGKTARRVSARVHTDRGGGRNSGQLSPLAPLCNSGS